MIYGCGKQGTLSQDGRQEVVGGALQSAVRLQFFLSRHTCEQVLQQHRGELEVQKGEMGGARRERRIQLCDRSCGSALF
jgi:hypothetical protein